MKIPSLKFNFAKHSRALEKLITDNSPTILTAVGVVGVAGTAFLTHKAALAASEAIYEENVERLEKNNGDPTVVLTRPEEFARVWKFYIAPVAVGLFTVTSIIAANRISAKRAAALAGVLALTQDDFKEYRDKVKEKMTGPKHAELEGEIAKDKVERVANKESPLYIPEGECLFVEAYTMRQFVSTKHKILTAESEFNRRIMRDDSACLSEFYDILSNNSSRVRRLEHTAISDSVGWNVKSPMEIEFTVTETPEGKPAFVINYVEPPIFRPHKSGDFPR